MWFGGLALDGFNFATPELTISADDANTFVARIKEYAGNHPKKAVIFWTGAVRDHSELHREP